ncbi:DHA2 family efflux MFS transporter permease subunit [Nocardioides hankookensis]|uniref:DHA2 family efflux MFS transporter permease subunit n=1 Tax=Nocardioides hankookensis TaxID=443157 RepID=A0ABW1LI57_9ACTN
MTTNTVRDPDLYDERGYRFRWMVMAVVIIADVMDLLDATIANLAGPSIREDLGGSASTLQWVLAAYTMSFAIGLVVSARVGDQVGRKRMFVIGMVGFTLASLLCGLAPTAGLLIAFRVLQGLFGAVMIPQGLAMVKQSFAPEDLQKAFIPFGPIMGLAAVLGPILAGVLLDADLFGTGWRMIFLINVPVGVVGAVLAWRYLPDVPRNPEARLDPVGAVLLTVASALLIYPLVQGREHDWPWWCFAMMAASAVVFGLFVLSERRSRNPVIEPSLFTHRGYVAGVTFIGVFFVAMSGTMLIFNLFLQLGLGFEPLKTGITMTPWALGMAIGAAASGAALGPRFGRRVLHAGLLISAAGIAWLAWTIGGADASLGGWDLAPMTLLAGFGSGLIFAPLFDIILSDLDDREVGTGSGVLNAVQQFAGALGVALLGTLFLQWVPEDGWFEATRTILWVTIGCYALAFAAVFLLPRFAREGVGE